MLVISSTVCVLGLVGCTHKPILKSAEPTIMPTKQGDNGVSNSLEKTIDAVSYSYVKSQLALANPKSTPGAQIVVLKNVSWMQALLDDALGHNGFTGTYVTISPKNKIIVILLTNKMNSGQGEKGYYNNTHDFAEAVNYAVHNEYLK